MKKKYKLRCFSCGLTFKNRDEVIRHQGRPYCGICIADQGTDYDLCPNEIDDAKMIEASYIRLYGEY